MAMPHVVFDDPKLLTIPTKRAAWSDRTALFMAEMSKLAYTKFEVLKPKEDSLNQAELDAVLARVLAGETGPTLDGGDSDDDRPLIPLGALALKEDLKKAGFELAGLFNGAGTDTQAFLAISKSGLGPVEPFDKEQVVVLSFRGTEQKAQDWITNLNILLKKSPIPGTEHEALIHTGFQRAFNSVSPAILDKLTPITDKGFTLYLTGHSLGGALALVATRDIARRSHGSCYTFGSPRVGRFGFADYIKTPIYRVVNSNDIVPRIPPAYIPTILMFVIEAFNVPFGGLLKGLLRKIEKYVHHGDMRFMRRSKGPAYKDLKVISNPSLVYRFFWYWPALFANRKGPWKAPIDDHSIDLYCEKLAAYATQRIDPLFESDAASDDPN